MPKVTVGIGINSRPPISRSRMIIRAAKVMRLDSLWAIDHWLDLYPAGIWDEGFSWTAKGGASPHEYFDWATLLGWAAGRVGKIQLAVGVTDPIRHHPVKLAQQILTLAHVARRPPILGIGAGEAENIVPYGMNFDTPVARLDEALRIIRLCFESHGPFDFEGEHFQLKRAMMDLAAPPGRTPEIWVAAHGPRMLRMTGRYGDGWYPAIPMAPDQYAANLGIIRDAAADAGRDPTAITPGLSMLYAVAGSEAEAEQLLDSPPLRFFALLAPHSFWEQLGHSHPLGEGFRGFIDFIPQRYEGPEILEAMAAVPTDVLAKHMVWGTPGQVTDRLDALVGAGLRHVTLVTVSALVSPRLARFAVRAAATISRAVHRM
jgi:phthiodiolone/phenolphthiodiolone dimycocerosates ketoreductase